MMSNLFNAIFLIQFIVVVGIILAKIYNSLMFGKWYTIREGVLLFVAFMISYAIGFSVVINYSTGITSFNELVPITMFKVETFLWFLNMMFLIVELMFHFKVLSEPQTTGILTIKR